MNRIELTEAQREQMDALVSQLNTTRTVAESFVGYFAKELNVNLQLYQFNADSLSFEAVPGHAYPSSNATPAGVASEHEFAQGEIVHQAQNGKVEAL
jgi:hypothetical protein